MTDDEALWALGLENRQDKMSALEMGLHANLVVDKSRGGRGQGGGAREYARLMGISSTVLHDAMKAASVASKLFANADSFKAFANADSFAANGIDYEMLTAKHRHLSEIASAPDYAWPALVTYLLSDESITIQKVAATTKRVKEIVDALPDWWAADASALVDYLLSDRSITSCIT